MLEAARLTGAVELVLTGCRPRCGGAPTAWLLLVVVRATSVASARGAVVLAAPGAALLDCRFFASVSQTASTGAAAEQKKGLRRSATLSYLACVSYLSHLSLRNDLPHLCAQI